MAAPLPCQRETRLGDVADCAVRGRRRRVGLADAALARAASVARGPARVAAVEDHGEAHLFVHQILEQVVHLHIAQVAGTGIVGLADVERHKPLIEGCLAFERREHGRCAPAVA